MFFDLLNIKPPEWHRAFIDGRRLTSKYSEQKRSRAHVSYSWMPQCTVGQEQAPSSNRPIYPSVPKKIPSN